MDEYSSMMNDVAGDVAGQVQDAIEDHIKKLCKEVIDNVISLDVQGMACYDVIEYDKFKRIFEEYL